MSECKFICPKKNYCGLVKKIARKSRTQNYANIILVDGVEMI